MLEPEGIFITNTTGELSNSTGRYLKHLSELRGLYSDATAFEDALNSKGDQVAYEVVEFRKPFSDLYFGTTIMNPGTVGDEFFMTRGHFHKDRTMGEIYYTQNGHGVLLLQSRNGETREIEMRSGVCAFIPPDWAHRTVNVGDEKLVFVWCCNQEAGHDYADILKNGMKKRVFRLNTSYEIRACGN